MKKLYINIVCLFLLFSLNVGMAQSDSETADKVSFEDSIQNETDTTVLRSIANDKWQKIKNDRAFIYTRENDKRTEKKQTPAKKAPLNNIDNLFNASMFRVCMFVLVGILLLIILRHLFFTENSTWFKRQQILSNNEAHGVAQIQTLQAWELALQQALQQLDFRLAVRILYLETLQKLQLRGLIELEQEATNWDYVNQISSSAYAKDFTTLTKYFDYIWYGQFTIDQHQFIEIEKRFKQFHRNLP